MPDLTDQQIERIAEVLASKVEDQRRPFIVPPEKHYLDHQFLQRLRDSEVEWRAVMQYVLQQKESAEQRETSARKIRNQVIGVLTVSGILGALGMLGAAVTQYVLHFLKGP